MASYKAILDSYRNLGKDEEVFLELFEKFDQNALVDAKSCVVIGPGPGVNEINFLQKFTPHLDQLICVEKDESCASALKANLEKKLPRKIRTSIAQVPVQDWTGPEEKVDLVLMFHCLYYLDEPERKKVLRACFGNWLRPRGRLYVMMIRDANEGEKHLMNEVYREQGGKLLIEAFHVKKDIEALGHCIEEEHHYHNYKMLKEIDSSFIDFLKYHSDPHLHDETIMEILDKLDKNGNTGHCSGSLFSVLLQANHP